MANLPLYKKIIDDIKAKIFSGELKEDDKIPTELEISNKYNVSRITSKRALTELENKNLIYRIQGSGSFVKPKVMKTIKTTSKNILFISPFSSNSGFGDYARGILNYLNDTEYNLHMHPNEIFEQGSLDDLILDYDGFIIYPKSSNDNLDILYSLYLKKHPTVILDKQFDSIPFTTVTPDNLQGGYDATKHLISLGHTDIAFFSTQKLENVSSVKQRYLGYLKAIHEANLEFYTKNIIPDYWNSTDINTYFENALEYYKKENITSIVAEHDLSAIKLINLIRKENLEIPKDLAIIGFDNLQASSLVEPALSTLAQDFEKIGYTAAKELILMMEKKTSKEENIVIPVELIVRASTKSV